MEQIPGHDKNNLKLRCHRRSNMDGMHFLLYAPVICAVVSFIGGIIYLLTSDCKSSKSTVSTKAANKSANHHYYEQPCSFNDHHYPDYDYISEVVIETEMKAHNERMEQMMHEQNKILAQNELNRIYDSTRPSLADQLDSRLTNIFKNPWEGIL